MALSTRGLNVPQWRHVPHCVQTRNAGLLIPSPRFRASGSGSKPKPGSKKSFPIKFVRSRRQPNPQQSPGWRDVLVQTAARWKSGWQARYAESRSHRLAVWGSVVFISGATYVYLFVLERVPITGRKRFSLLARPALAKLEEAEREMMERLQVDKEKLFIKNDYPGLRKIEAVLNRLVKASGLDDVAWEIRVLDKPSRSSPRSCSSAL